MIEPAVPPRRSRRKAALLVTTRALFASYNGPLYQIQRSSDHSYRDIAVFSAGGYADAASQVSFCSGTSCTITKIYDQTTEHNDLPISWGGFWKGPGPGGSDIGADAMALPVTAAGHQVFGVKVKQGVGYRIDHAKGVATGSQPEGIYMVTSSNYTNQLLLRLRQRGELPHRHRQRHHERHLLGQRLLVQRVHRQRPVGRSRSGERHAPHQHRLQQGPQQHRCALPVRQRVAEEQRHQQLHPQYGNGASGGLTTTFSGPLPGGYSPMKLDSSVLLGTGGDNSVSGTGEFFEGAMTAGYPSDATENAVQAAITAAGYGVGGGGGNTTGALRAVGAGRCLEVPGASTTPGTQTQMTATTAS
ncbi:arabinofuranosidase catalytic domain-containing protein [Streptomyces sp. NEAU-174]|uniref:arabinofuranosidase catalytic domain-containing protein n=1 Tax=Streptomyces sp. NEAU-174 TaxID=3458254 RepID=UPI00404485A0